MPYTYYEEVHSLQNRKLVDDKSRRKLNIIEPKVNTLEEIIRQSKQGSLNLLHLLINMQTSYDLTGKFVNVNSAESKLEHEASLMKIGDDICVYWVNNAVSTTDNGTTGEATGCIYRNGTVTDLTVATGVYFATGRVQHGHEEGDVIIAIDSSANAYLVKCTDNVWSATQFKNNSGLLLDGCNSQMVYKDGKFYHILTVNENNKDKNHPIIYFDTETMTIEKSAGAIVLPMTFDGIYETCLHEFNDQIYVAFRPSYSSLRRNMGLALVGILEGMETELPIVNEYILLPDGSSRPLLFDYNNKLFCITNANDRITGRLFDITNIHSYEPVAQILNNVNYPDVLVNGSTVYWCATDKKNVAGCKVVHGTFPYMDLLK